MSNKPELAPRSKCTGCTACAAICKMKAISLVEDENGFKYPQIDVNKCISCGLCTKTCPIVTPNNNKNGVLSTYAAYANDNIVLSTSSSGGVFALLAEEVINKGGVVFGCAQDENFKVKHIKICSTEGIDKLKGSKYVQSDMEGVFSSVKRELESDKIVLFSGTPCQVVGLKSYLKKPYPQLITIDLVCHGVPSLTFFKHYLEWYEKKYNEIVNAYVFRDTVNKDMTCVSRISVTDSRGRRKTHKTYYNPKYYFYYLYMIGAIYRESCYHCPCLPDNRASDITLGDYWGIEEQITRLANIKGVSVVVVHTKIGEEVLKLTNATYIKSTYEDAVRRNRSIVEPVNKPKIREKIMEYDSRGEEELIFDYCKRCIGGRQILFDIKRMIPVKFKRSIRRVINNN